MIEYIDIRNFQKHRKLRIELDPNLTVLVGPTDHGKSAVIRAFRWVFFNKSPPNFTSWGKSQTRVEIRINGHIVIRKKGKRNLYIVDKKVLAAVGTKVPKEVQDILNISADNFQRQHDAHYWITLSPGQVAKQLNSVVNLGVIDRVQKNIASRIKKTRTKVEISQDRLKTALEEKKQLAWTTKANDLLCKIERRKRRFDNTINRVNVLRSLVSDVSIHINAIKRDKDRFVRVDKILNLHKNVDQKWETVSAMRNAIADIAIAQKLAKIEVPDLSEIDGMVVKYNLLLRLILDIEMMETKLCPLVNELLTVTKKLKMLQGKPCPVCGQVIKTLQ